jgi:hypothetical protein
MTSNLTPTPVVDKNGRQTTVYKRAEGSVKYATVIPAPVVVDPAQDEIDAKVNWIIDEIDESVHLSDQEDREAVRSTLETYSPEFLIKVEEALQHLETVTIASLLIAAGESESLVSEALTFMPQMEVVRFHESLNLVKSLHRDYYPGLPKVKDYGVADDHVQSQCIAILKISLAMKRYSDDRDGDLRMVDVGTENIDRAAIMADQRMIALVLERPDEADLIVDTIRERGTGEFGVIHAVLSNEAIALSSGTL